MTGGPRAASTPGPVIAGFAVAVYLLFIAVLGYSAGFFADAGVPKGIDQGPPAAGPTGVAAAVAIDSRCCRCSRSSTR
jgi:hypothetical protein